MSYSPARWSEAALAASRLRALDALDRLTPSERLLVCRRVEDGPMPLARFRRRVQLGAVDPLEVLTAIRSELLR